MPLIIVRGGCPCSRVSGGGRRLACHSADFPHARATQMFLIPRAKIFFKNYFTILDI